MAPNFSDGDFVVASRLVFKLPRIDDVIVVDHPCYKRIIKRVLQVSVERGVLLTGDNAVSLIPETMGWIAAEHIHGKVIFSVKPKCSV